MKKTSVSIAIAALALTAGCAAPGPRTAGLGGGDYQRTQARTAQAVEFGTIDSIRSIVLDAGTGGAGSAVAPLGGALVGGAIGSQIGKGRGNKAAIILGALAGAAAGSAIQTNRDTLAGLEITVITPDRALVVVQADEGLGFRVGDRVRLINDGRVWRVAPR